MRLQIEQGIVEIGVYITVKNLLVEYLGFGLPLKQRAGDSRAYQISAAFPAQQEGPCVGHTFLGG